MVVNLQKLVMAVVIISAIFAGFLVFISDLAAEDAYNIDITEEQSFSSFNLLDNLSRELNPEYDNTLDIKKEGNLAFFSGLYDFYKIGKAIVRLPFAFLNDMWGTIEDKLELPAWVGTLIILIILISAMFALAAVLIKWRA